ncbi:hypothetical protein [Cupriavidus metallidurans]
MKKSVFARIAAVALMAIAVLSGCKEQTPEEKIKAQTQDKVHALTADERQRAQINGKQFFEKEWKTPAGLERGALNECRPSDSNYNGLVTCTGMVPQITGGYKEVKRYCGYTPELVGCSDEDTVK